MKKAIYPILIIVLAAGIAGVALTQQVMTPKVPENYYNPPENLNPDLNYTPGDWPMPEAFNGKLQYYTQQAELADAVKQDEGNVAVTVGMGEIAFNVIKNETGSVLGYFKNYFGAGKFSPDAPEKLDLLIDINSLDTGVPGRNNRILGIFFESMNLDFGTARVVFEKFDLNGKTLNQISDGNEYPVKAQGRISLNGVTRELSSSLMVKKESNTWVVETAEPIKLLISDFAFGDRIYELMKSCNHQSMGNAVTVTVKLYFR